MNTQEENLHCTYCNKQCKNQNSFKNHERTCPENPNRKYKNGMTGKKGSNQYIKAKELNLPYPMNPQKGKPGIKGRKHSEKTKKLLSEMRTEFLKNNPDKVPYKLNHYSKGPSYPEKYWKNVLDNNNISYEEQYQISLYTLDFAIVDLKIDLEIDGNQHY